MGQKPRKVYAKLREETPQDHMNLEKSLCELSVSCHIKDSELAYLPDSIRDSLHGLGNITYFSVPHFPQLQDRSKNISFLHPVFLPTGIISVSR